MSFQFTIKLLDTPEKIEKKVNQEIVKVLNRNLPSIAADAQRILRRDLSSIFYGSPEYKEIIRYYRGSFGFPSGTEHSRMRAIIEGLQETIEVVHKRVFLRSGKFQGGLTVQAYPDDFNYILNLPEAIVITEKDEIITWLFDMLFSGDRIIISDYSFRYAVGLGRSGLGFMASDIGGWRIPPLISGTSDNNWITRAVKYGEKAIKNIIEKTISDLFRIRTIK